MASDERRRRPDRGEFGFDLGPDTWTRPDEVADVEPEPDDRAPASAPVAGAAAEGAPTTPGADGPTTPADWARHPATPWVVFVLVAALAFGVVLIGRDDGSGGGSGGTDGGAQQGGAAGSEGEDDGEAADDVCPPFSLDANLIGEPSSASEPGIHTWHDVEGFKLRLVAGDGVPATITGTLKGAGVPIALVAPTGDPKIVDFEGAIAFELGADVDELTFKASCSTQSVTFDLRTPGGQVAPDLVTVGRDSTVDEIPFTLTRGA